MRQRKLGSHTPPCHRRMVITTLFSVLLVALQRRPVLYHTRWLLAVHPWEGGGGTWSWDGTPPWVRGPHTRKNVGTPVQIHTQRPQHAKKF